MTRHLFIPDVQAKEGVPLQHLEALGNYVVQKQPEVIVMIGDWADMPSLSSYDVGKKSFEGRMYTKDIESARLAMDVFLAPIKEYNMRQAINRKKQYKPRMVMCYGNHDQGRIERAIEHDRKLEGLISVKDLGFEESGWECHDFLDIVNIDGIRYCLDPEHKVLTSDLKWVPLKDVKIGDTLVAFDENAKNKGESRKYATAVVEKHDFDMAEKFKVTLADGTVFLATKEHRWLVNTPGSRMHWMTTQEISERLAKGLKVSITKLFDTWEQDVSRDAGWLAGIFDGEGHLGKPNSKQGGIQLGVSQNEGIVLDKIMKLLDEHNFSYNLYSEKRCNKICIHGPSSEKLKFLGVFRPERLISKFKAEHLGRLQKADNGAVVDIIGVEPDGVGQIVKIQTSTGTMIADGYPHHNCHYFVNPNSLIKSCVGGNIDTKLKNLGWSFSMGHQQTLQYGIQYLPDGESRQGLVAGAFYMHDEDYMGSQGNRSHWRGVVMKNQVENGKYDPCFVSINYLLEKYL